MTKSLVPALVALALTAQTGAVLAKPHNIHIDLKREALSSIHAPTGCVALVEYDDGAFVQAFITDPLCLPEGVSQRYIPASALDFYVLDPQQAAIIGR